MDSRLNEFIQILFFLPGFIVGLTLHEFSHAFMAVRFGDPTPREKGRLSLNPFRHLDIFGTVMLFVAGFGWAKPVPVDSRFLRNPRRDMLWIALAGPVSNLLLAYLLGMLVLFFYSSGSETLGMHGSILLLVLVQGVWINIILAVFNLLPVPPLDGSRIASSLIPEKLIGAWNIFERVGPMVLLAGVLLANFAGISIFSAVLMPIAGPIFDLFLGNWLPIQ